MFFYKNNAIAQWAIGGGGSSGRSSGAPRELNFFLVSYLTDRNGKILSANSISTFLHF